MNGVNINLFRFEYDLTWMAFFMDARDRFYARYGGREDGHAESHLNRESLLAVMRQALALHETGNVQTGRYEPAGKPARTPEEIPTMQAMIARRKENKCIHCHDVKVATLRHQQSLDRFSRDMVFTYPPPSTVGLRLDPKVQNEIAKVGPDSPADRAGLRAGDVLVAADGQRILTLADFARVLELTPKRADLPLELERDGRKLAATLSLAGEWKKTEDPSWRASLHVAGPNGGFWGGRLAADERRKAGIAAEALALRVGHIWQARTRQSGLKVGDIVVAFDGLRRDMTIRQLHAHLSLNRNYGDTIPLIVRRDGKEHAVSLKLIPAPPKLE